MSESLERFILPSDDHLFVGRIFGLSIVGLHFETYDELSKHSDCKYVLRTNNALSNLVRRVESLNLVGNMIWPKNLPGDFGNFPISRYEWLTVSANVFLMRFVSVVDCALILIGEVFECDFDARDCTAANLKKAGLPKQLLDLVDDMIADQGTLRKERNGRFHHGTERGFSSDDRTFRIAALFEHRQSGMLDSNGQPLPMDRYLQEGLIELQTEFNLVMHRLVPRLNCLYDLLAPKFEETFSPLFETGSFGAKRKSGLPKLEVRR